MRDQVLKPRDMCKRRYVLKGDYPEDFLKIWNQRKVSDYSGRKAAGFGVYRVMKSGIDKLQAENKILRDTMEDCLMLSQCLTTRTIVRSTLEKIKQGEK